MRHELMVDSAADMREECNKGEGNMFAKSRGLILALGLILSAASPAPSAGPPPGKASRATMPPHGSGIMPPAHASAELVRPLEPAEYYTPCGERGSYGKSDLCAQWTAAAAAEESAEWSWYQMWLSAIGALGLGITLLFNFRALRLAEKESQETKGALAIAKRNADAAAEQVRISDDLAKRELRAYVTAVSAEIAIWVAKGVTNIKLEIVLHNSGKTTALVKSSKAKFQSNDWKCSAGKSATIISPRGYETVTVQCGTGGVRPDLNLVARMFIEYADYLGDIHTEDSFWTYGPPFPAPTSRTKYELVCHSKIDESLGRYIDPVGEEEDRREQEAAMEQARHFLEGQFSPNKVGD